ncbi:MAG: hypothetical protein ACD_22C00171G0014 [uncultured bacterium]|nr:MAG: hypothetical protein ACD_22C00171G0014 [uncultured bacterium]
MLTVVLPGYSPSNKAWVLETKRQLEVSGEVYAHGWRHWDGSSVFDSDFEIAKIIDVVGDTDLNFVAKSVGTDVLMKLLPKIVKHVSKIVLCGIPIDPIKHTGSFKLVDPEKILVIQNTGDPFMPSKLIKSYIGLINRKIRVLEKKADNHDYPYYEDFRSFLFI